MIIRIMGIVDQKIRVKKEDYEKAKAENKMQEFMEPYLSKLQIELTHAPIEEFN